MEGKNKYSNKWTAEKVRLKGEQMHQELYDYSNVKDPVDRFKDIEIFCNMCEHTFTQTIHNHFNRKQKCPHCQGKAPYTYETLVEKGRLHHGNQFDYSENEQLPKITKKTRIKIKCNYCDYITKTSVDSHINMDSGCLNCNNMVRYDYDWLVTKGRIVHDDKYDYSKAKDMEKLTVKTRIIIKCNKCLTEFKQSIDAHINAEAGCSECVNQIKYDLKRFLKKSLEKHGYYYDYSNINENDIQNRLSVVKIKCNECGLIFSQKVGDHVRGSGCTKCNRSHGELWVEKYLIEHGINYICEYKFPSLKKKRYDFMLPDLKCVIEYDGIQHFEYINLFYKSEDDFESRKRVDIEKTIHAIEQGYRVVRLSHLVKDVSDHLDYALYDLSDIYVSCNLYDKHMDQVSEFLKNIYISYGK